MRRSRHNPLVSVIVVAYDSGAELEECLQSILAQDYPRVEVILVDNASRDGAAIAAGRAHAGRLRLVAPGSNLGFGGGCNAGFAVAQGAIIGLLNPDAVADPGWAWAAVELFAARPDVGMVACRVLDYADRTRIDTTGHLVYRDGLNRGRGRGEPASAYDVEAEVAFPSGSAGFYRREAFEAAGGFDASMFLYGDDIDLGLTIRRLGWGCIYSPASTAFHRYSQAAGAYSATKAYHVERNRILVMLKHFPAAAIAASPIHTLRRAFWHNVSALSGRGSSGRFVRDGSVAKLYVLMLRAYLDAARRAPAALRERKRLKALDRTGEARFMRWLDEFAISAKELAMKD